MPDTNQVRQILMNELGLTREAVRQEMVEIVRDTVDKKFNHMLAEGTFLDVLTEVVRQQFIVPRYGQDSISQRLEKHAQ